MKSRYFWIVLGIMVVLGAGVTVGLYVEWDLTVMLLMVVAVLLALVLLLVLRLARASRGASAIEESIKVQASRQLKSTRPDQRGEVEELQRGLEEAIAMLKQSKLSRGRSGRQALYALPWYMIIGPPGAGKTTAIANSGLNFPVGTGRVRGVGGTRNCDWFFSDAAILLDTAGRYMTEQEDNDEWLAFLDTLKQHRRERPINGVLVGISVADLLEAEPDEILWHADNVRTRIDELVTRLGEQFPVYLVFMKCDLVQGFVEFFGQLSRKEREQIWGCTFDADPDDQEDVQTTFEREFDQLVGVLVNLRIGRLKRPMSREERQKIYAFPLQLASVKERLSQFVGRLCRSNPYQEDPLFRGFYLTSGTQEGVPIDWVIDAVAREFDLPPEMHAPPTEALETKSYFIKDLFTEVIIPDRYLARRTSRAATLDRLTQSGVAAAAVVVVGLCLALTLWGYRESRQRLLRAEETARSAAAITWASPDAYGAHFRTLDGLHEAIDDLEHPGWLGLTGLGRGGRVIAPVRDVYRNALRGFVEANVLGALRDSLRLQARYDDLKAYLLLTSEADRLAAEPLLPDELRDRMVEVAGGYVEAQGGAGVNLGASLDRHLGAFAADLAADADRALPADPAAVSDARRRLNQGPQSLEALYNRIESGGRAAGVCSDPNIPRTAFFENRLEILCFYTRQGWEEVAQRRLREESESLAQDEDWVLGTRSQLPEELRDPERLEEELTRIYFDRYAAAWERLIETTHLRSFPSVRAAETTLLDLGSPGSPLAYFLGWVADETRFDAGLLADVQERVGMDRPPQHPVDRRFQWLHALKPELARGGGGADPALTEAIEALNQVGNEIAGLSGSDAVAYARDVIGRNAGLVIAHQTINLPTRTEHLFTEPLTFAWSAVLAEAQRALNERWEDEVYRPFQDRLAGRYPFRQGAATEAARQEVEAYFGTDGPIETFWRDDLEDFVDRDRPRLWMQRGLDVDGALRARERAAALRRGLLDGGLLFRLSPEQTVDLVRDDQVYPDRVYLDIHGTQSEYNQTFVVDSEPFAWRPDAEQRAVLELTTTEGPLPRKSHTGEWALFRLLEEAVIEPQSATRYRLSWPFTDRAGREFRVVYDLTTDTPGPFRDPRAFFAFSPSRTLQ